MRPFSWLTGRALMMPQEMAYVVITPNDNVVILKNAQPRSPLASKGQPGSPK